MSHWCGPPHPTACEKSAEPISLCVHFKQDRGKGGKGGSAHTEAHLILTGIGNTHRLHSHAVACAARQGGVTSTARQGGVAYIDRQGSVASPGLTTARLA